MVHDEQNQFFGYDSGDVSDHGYDYESDDLPAGCHFDDDDDVDIKTSFPAPTLSTAANGPSAASQTVAPAHTPAPRPHLGLCIQYDFTVDNNTFAFAMMYDGTECRDLVCHPVAARAGAKEQTQNSDTRSIRSIISAVLGLAGPVLSLIATVFLVWELKYPGSTRRKCEKVFHYSRRLRSSC